MHHFEEEPQANDDDYFFAHFCLFEVKPWHRVSNYSLCGSFIDQPVMPYSGTPGSRFSPGGPGV